MSSGEVHLYNLERLMPLGAAWSAVMGATSYVLTEDVVLSVVIGVCSIAGYAMGRWIEPDLDLISISSSEGRMMRELPILGLLLVMWWFPYAYIMRFVGIVKKGHRNFFSHAPVVSTFFRVVWLLLFPLFSVPLWYVYTSGNFEYVLYPVFGVFLGLCLTDTIHWVLDWNE